ncbi:MAG: hypothetical protein JRN29_05085, partial [Nitrososphaerota archaeon]|nr:hypothetical protein [Nitrososphaerota archaeon]
SVVSALTRLRRSGTPLSMSIARVMAQSSVAVRTDVAKFVVYRSRETLEAVLKAISSYPEAFIHIAEGTSMITSIVDEKYLDRITSRLEGGRPLEKKTSLATITIHSPKEIIDTPGCVFTIYSRLSRSGINIQDTTSSYTDTIIVVGLEDSGKAFEAVTDLISVCRSIQQGKGRRGTPTW